MVRYPWFFAIAWSPMLLIIWRAQRARRILRAKAA
jgi:hypothetical protein